ncbi:MAG: YecA family protein [Desulfomonilaceae bacterium]
MKQKIGRNDTCWCGSGQKNKKCHAKREDLRRTSPYDIEKKIIKSFSARYCLHPDAKIGLCKGEIVRAHTVQRSGGLDAVAENNHVYGFKPSFSAFTKNDGFIVPELIGVRKASTFTGFCGYHDSETFAPIERQPFQGTPEQCFLHSYRALCREVFTKKAAFDSNDLLSDTDKGSSNEIQRAIQRLVNTQKMGLKKGLTDIVAVKRIFDKRLLEKNYDGINRCVIYFDRIPEIVCSGGFAPVYDLQGQQLQDLCDLDKSLEIAFLTIFPTGRQGVAILTWLPGTSDVCLNFVESIWRLGTHQIPDSLGRIAIEHLENTFFTPSWWDGLSELQRNSIIAHALSGALITRENGCLANDRISYLNVKVVNVETNVSDLK